MKPGSSSIWLRLATVGILAFLYIPLLIIVLYAFDTDRSQSWPIQGLTLDWFSAAFANPTVGPALALSIEVALASTTIALILGTLASFAVQRYSFFGRGTVSFLLVLPIALPGIVTGMALNATINASGIGFTTFTIILGHATFCIVVVFNDVIARLRRTSRRPPWTLAPTLSRRSATSPSR